MSDDRTPGLPPTPPIPAVPPDAPIRVAQHLDIDALSAYRDGLMPPPERAAAVRHLATCLDCARELAELRATVMLLQTLPHYVAGRDFQLGPEYARRGPGRRGWAVGSLLGWLDRLVPALPALRIATVAVAVLLLGVITGDVVTQRQAAETGLPQAAVQRAAPPAAIAPADEAAPAVDADLEEAANDAAPDGDAGLEQEAANEAPPPPLAARPVTAPTAEADTADEADTAAEAGPPMGAFQAAPAPSGAARDRADEAAAGPGDGVVNVAGTEPAAPASIEGEAGPSDDSRPAPTPAASVWRLATVALGLILVWLIVLLVATTAWRRRGGW